MKKFNRKIIDEIYGNELLYKVYFKYGFFVNFNNTKNV